MEIMVVMIITTIVAAFALPNYSKSIRKGYERNAISAIQSVHTMASLYDQRNGSPLIPATGDVADINSNFNLNIIESGMTISYNSNGTTFTITATITGGGVPLPTLLADNAPLGDDNPCCSAGSCLVVPDCF